jgi:hypothetical protein
MTHRWLAAAIALGCLAGGPARADVTYMFFDDVDTTKVDLEFTVAQQLSVAEPSETFLTTGGAFGSNFAGGDARYFQSPPDSAPFIELTAPSQYSGLFDFTNSFAGAPGNGSFPGSGNLRNADDSDVADLGSVTISGVSVVPEPATWILLSLGFVGLAAAAVAGRRPRAIVS